MYYIVKGPYLLKNEGRWERPTFKAGLGSFSEDLIRLRPLITTFDSFLGVCKQTQLLPARQADGRFLALESRNLELRAPICLLSSPQRGVFCCCAAVGTSRLKTAANFKREILMKGFAHDGKHPFRVSLLFWKRQNPDGLPDNERNPTYETSESRVQVRDPWAPLGPLRAWPPAPKNPKAPQKPQARPRGPRGPGP